LEYYWEIGDKAETTGDIDYTITLVKKDKNPCAQVHHELGHMFHAWFIETAGKTLTSEPT